MKYRQVSEQVIVQIFPHAAALCDTTAAGLFNRTFIRNDSCMSSSQENPLSSTSPTPSSAEANTVSQELLAGAIEREKYYHSLLANMPLAAYACDKSGRITFFNEAAVQLWGYRPNINDPLLKYCAGYKVFIDGQLISPDQTPMAIALQTGQSFHNVQALVERPDGATFHASVNINPLLDEQQQITGAINVFLDISEYTHASQDLQHSEAQYRAQANHLEKLVTEQTLHLVHKSGELKQSEERYHKMIEEVEDYAIILLDKDGIVQNWNRGAQKIKGYTEAEIVGRSFQEFYLPEDREKGLPMKLLEKARTTGKAVHEGWRRRKDGSAFWGSILLTALHNEAGRVIGFSKVTRDLTEKKLVEDKLQENLSELEFRNKELEQFVYACSHDIKEPLRKILLYSHFIAENAGDTLNEKTRGYLSRVLFSAERMKKLIDDLLTYSLQTAKAAGYSKVKVGELLDEVIHELKEEREEKRVHVEVKNTLPVIQAIPFQIRQLLYNLLQNAIKYKHPDRNGQVVISSEIVQGKPEGAAAGRYYQIRVADNGVGFDSANAVKIFKLFHRLQNAPTATGSGIGLAICKKIAQNHKGTIVAEGQPGKGATFNIYLPV